MPSPRHSLGHNLFFVGVGDPADDWVEYADQKTKRKYYYSASRKKSTWSLPSGGMGAPECKLAVKPIR